MVQIRQTWMDAPKPCPECGETEMLMIKKMESYNKYQCIHCGTEYNDKDDVGK